MLNTSTNLIIKFTQSFRLCFAFGYVKKNMKILHISAIRMSTHRQKILRVHSSQIKCYEPKAKRKKIFWEKSTKSFSENPNIRVFGAQHGFSFVFHSHNFFVDLIIHIV